MAFFAWTPALELPNEHVNEQHRELVNRINALHAALHGEGDQDADAVLVFLVQYLADHFASEESLMQRSGYPYLADHRAEHQRLKEQVQIRAQKLAAGRAVDGEDLLRFLKRWLVEHIIGWDSEMASHLGMSQAS